MNNKGVYSSLSYYCRETPCEFLVSVPEINATGPVRISPNPARGFLNVKFDSDKKADELIIVDMLGQEKLRINLDKNVSEHKINFQGFTEGMYLLMIRDGGRITAQEKVVVLK